MYNLLCDLTSSAVACEAMMHVTICRFAHLRLSWLSPPVTFLVFPLSMLPSVHVPQHTRYDGDHAVGAGLILAAMPQNVNYRCKELRELEQAPGFDSSS